MTLNSFSGFFFFFFEHMQRRLIHISAYQQMTESQPSKHACFDFWSRKANAVTRGFVDGIPTSF